VLYVGKGKAIRRGEIRTIKERNLPNIRVRKAWKDVREDICKSDAIQSEMEITKNKNPQARQK
jgi:hypothetical protein